MTSEEFEDNELVVDAILRNQEIISEAVKNILEEIRLKYPYIECRKIAGFRDILIHTYFGFEMETVWDIIKNKLPELKNKLPAILEREP
ncbi:MAG: DUF86 domain-containing protein [Methanophagales archaeon]|nr:DUF86 domain-containing protein [Methanophagales archaeon]